jgi:hypothetical protein
LKLSNIFAHRGCWRNQSDHNSINSILDAVKSGFSVETDIRDFAGNLVISHDPATECSLPMKDLILETKEIFSKGEIKIALNIKSDGLSSIILHDESINQFIKNFCYVFDMSIPDLIHYRENSFNYLIRLSEYEDNFSLYEQSSGIWFDSFDQNYKGIESTLEKYSKKAIIFVSPELHGKNKNYFWDMVKDCDYHMNDNFCLCTDYPNEAAEHFGA